MEWNEERPEEDGQRMKIVEDTQLLEKAAIAACEDQHEERSNTPTLRLMSLRAKDCERRKGKWNGLEEGERVDEQSANRVVEQKGKARKL